ncbi:ubiquitin-specific protease ubp15 [Linderina pennispora]|nr:ubiquitin-specific protease ubp15 [Linderina pennispora]
MTPRVNKTLRCEMPMAWSSTTTVKDLMKYHGTSSNSLYLYCELRVLSDPVFFGRIPIPQGVTMIHLKFYNPAEGKMIGLGHIYVNARLPIKTILPILCQKAGLAKKTELLLYEEIKPWLIEAIDPKKKFEQVELQLGDIICFQAKASADLQTTEARAHPKLITGFFDRLAARLRVQNEGRNH